MKHTTAWMAFAASALISTSVFASTLVTTDGKPVVSTNNSVVSVATPGATATAPAPVKPVATKAKSKKHKAKKVSAPVAAPVEAK